jgi:hypothetical protein
MSESLYKKHFGEGSKLVKNHKLVRLVAANGLAVPYIGYTIMDIKIGKQVIQSRGILVQKDTGSRVGIDSNSSGFASPMILGMNVIRDVKGNPGIKVKPSGGPLPCVGLVRAPVGGFHLPARSVTSVTVPGNVSRKSGKQFSQQKDYVVEPLREQANSRYLVAHTIVSGNGPWTIPLVNIGEEDVLIPGRTPLGKVGEVEHLVFSEVGFENGDGEIVVQCSQVGQSEHANEGVQVDLSGVDCSESERRQLHQLLSEFADTLTQDEVDVGFTDRVKHQIPVVDDIPVSQAYRRIPPTQLGEVKKHIQGLLEREIIRPSSSPYASPIVLVRKKMESSECAWTIGS